MASGFINVSVWMSLATSSFSPLTSPSTITPVAKILIPGVYQSRQVSVLASDPVHIDQTRHKFFENLSPRISSFSMTTSAYGGYDTATIELVGDKQYIQNWFTQGLNRRIRCYSPYLTGVWDGYLNSMSLAYGPMNQVLGPVSDIANKVIVSYTDYDTNAKKFTPPAIDLDSITKYGTLYHIESQGKILKIVAEAIRDKILEEKKTPIITPSISSSGGWSLSLECLGYFHKLETYPYNNVASDSALQTATQKLKDVLSAQPDGIYSTDYALFDENPIEVNVKEVDNKIADTIIKSVIDLGSAQNKRMTFGCYNDLQFRYQQISQAEADYQIHLSDPRALVKGIGGDAVKLWTIAPGKKIIVNDFYGTQTFVIEAVTFSAPYGISISSSPNTTVPQMLARLAGVS